jgi:hypothetical protein
VTNSKIKIGTAGILLALGICCSASIVQAQLYLSVGGSGMNNASAQGSPTSNLGLGGPGSATEVQRLNEPAIGSNRGLGFPLLNQQEGKQLGVTGNSSGASSLSSAGDRSSSPANSVTNSLTGPVNNLGAPSTSSAAAPPAKRKQTNNAAAAVSSGRGAAAQVSPSKSP